MKEECGVSLSSYNDLNVELVVSARYESVKTDVQDERSLKRTCI